MFSHHKYPLVEICSLISIPECLYCSLYHSLLYSLILLRKEHPFICVCIIAHLVLLLLLLFDPMFHPQTVILMLLLHLLSLQYVSRYIPLIPWLSENPEVGLVTRITLVWYSSHTLLILTLLLKNTLISPHIYVCSFCQAIREADSQRKW